MKTPNLILLFLVIFACKNTTENKADEIQIVIDSTGLRIEPIDKKLLKPALTAFLQKPIDLQEFKKRKGMQFTTSVVNGTDYYYNPKIKDSIFYNYNYPAENFTDSKKIDHIVVFKYGENKHQYEDQTEILIELEVFNKDSALGKANLVGLSKTELESQFGNDYLTFDNGIFYSYENKILILKMDSSDVKSFRYIKMNSEKIDNDLITQIMQ